MIFEVFPVTESDPHPGEENFDNLGPYGKGQSTRGCVYGFNNAPQLNLTVHKVIL